MQWLVYASAKYGYGMWYNIAVIVPAVGFLMFLVSQMKSSLDRLRRSGSSSYIMASCYALLWLVSIFNLLWCVLQVWQGLPAQATAFNVLSLVTRSGMLLLEVSVVVFLLQGNHVRGWDALLQALILSSIIAAIDVIVKAIYIFGFGVALFIDGNDVGDWHKWGFWFAHKLLLVAVYASILCLPHTKWQNRLPGFYEDSGISDDYTKQYPSLEDPCLLGEELFCHLHAIWAYFSHLQVCYNQHQRWKKIILKAFNRLKTLDVISASYRFAFRAI